MNTLIGMILGGLAGIGYSQALAAAADDRPWLPWLVLGVLASLALAGLCRWVRYGGEHR